MNLFGLQMQGARMEMHLLANPNWQIREESLDIESLLEIQEEQDFVSTLVKCIQVAR
ncbi:hypothetical protein D3C87_1686890 [compost metagenome]